MKTKLFLTTAIMIISVQLNGQQFSFGLKPSLNLLKPKYIEKPSFSRQDLGSRLSYGLGLTANTNLSKILQVQFEPRFVERGYKYSWGGINISTYKNGYISLPILLEINIKYNFKFEIGPEISYLIYSRETNSNGHTGVNNSLEQNHFELSGLVGLSHKIIGDISLGVRYGLAFTPNSDGSILYIESGSLSSFKIYNRYFELFTNIPILKISKK
jgi:hypothetical protein